VMTLADRITTTTSSSSTSSSTTDELSVEERRRLVRAVAEVVGRRTSDMVHTRLEAGGDVDDATEKVFASTEVHREIGTVNETRLRNGQPVLSQDACRVVFDGVMARLFGLGELDQWWHHPEVEHIDINGSDSVWVTYAGGRRVQVPPVTETDDELIALVRTAARRLGLLESDFDARHPLLDVQLPDGSRLYAVFGGHRQQGVAVRPLVSIRRHRYLHLTPNDLVKLGLLPEPANRFICAWVRAGGNLIVSGDWNAGKTTALRAWAGAIPPWHRVITVEARLTELGLHTNPVAHPNVAAMYSRPPGPEGDGEITVHDLVTGPTRRLNATRVICGEVLGPEIGPTLDLMSGSSRGSMFTIHAATSRAVITRCEQYGLMSEPPMQPLLVRYMLAQAQPLIVNLTGDETVEGHMTRTVTSIREVTGLEGDHVGSTELWATNRTGHLTAVAPLSKPWRDRLTRHGWTWETDGWETDLH
jgi:pilus assembly protein CpaF